MISIKMVGPHRKEEHPPRSGVRWWSIETLTHPQGIVEVAWTGGPQLVFAAFKREDWPGIDWVAGLLKRGLVGWQMLEGRRGRVYIHPADEMARNLDSLLMPREPSWR